MPIRSSTCRDEVSYPVYETGKVKEVPMLDECPWSMWRLAEREAVAVGRVLKV
jgi:hypothetical protein